MPKLRAYGADATLLVCRETTYGTAPTNGYRSLDFKSTDLSSEQPLGDDPLLGRGRNAQDPYRGLVSDEGKLEIPIDLRNIGHWLTGLFGDAASTAIKASGSFAFSAQPAANSTIALNGTTWTFVSGTPAANQTQIGANIDATLTALATNLNASADVQVAKCTYTANTAADRLDISFDTAGTGGNTFTLAASTTPASNATPSAPTLRGGGYRHLWNGGADAIPSYTFEIGHPKLVTPVFFRHLGTVMDSLSFELGEAGPASATIQVVAGAATRSGGRRPKPVVAARLERARALAHGSARSRLPPPSTPPPTRWRSSASPNPVASSSAAVRRWPASPAATWTLLRRPGSNNLERVRVIRDDGKIAGADPTLATCTGTIKLRFDGATLMADAAGGDPVPLSYALTMAEGWALSSDLFPSVPAQAQVHDLRP